MKPDFALLKIEGEVALPGSVAYSNTLGRLFNVMHCTAAPKVIVVPRGTADVVEVVRFARDNGLSVSVMGGGHNAAGNCVKGEV